MTNFRQVTSNKLRGANKKDPQAPRQTKVQRQAAGDEMEAAGFTWTPGPWRYTWEGNFPVFIVAPGIITNEIGTHAGLVARCAAASIEIFFPYGTRPASIAAQLNDEILAIMRHDANVDDPIVVGGEVVGPEIPF
jgi:hypothetical protein